MHKRIGRALFVLGVAALSALLGSTLAMAGRPGSPIGLVPPAALAVAKIDWTVVRGDDRLSAMLNTGQLERSLAQLDINGDDISEVVMFSGIESAPTGLVGAIFRGWFSAAKVTIRFKAQGMTPEIYHCRTIYCDSGDQSCASFLPSGLLAIGTQKAVKGVMDVDGDPRLGLTTRRPFTTVLARYLNSRQPISFMMALPLEYQVMSEAGIKVISAIFDLAGLGPLGFVIDKIGVPRALGFSLTHSGATFPAELVAQMKDDSAAALISGTFNLAQSIGSLMPSDQMSAADREMLKNISLTRTGAVLTTKMVLRESDLPTPRR